MLMSFWKISPFKTQTSSPLFTFFFFSFLSVFWEKKLRLYLIQIVAYKTVVSLGIFQKRPHNN